MYAYVVLEKKREVDAEITKKDIEVLTMLMDKAAITPNKKRGEEEGKFAEFWGKFIKNIELNTPAEWLDKRGDKYFDTDNIELYIKNMYTRAMKNFITGSRDFSIMVEDGTSEDRDIDS